MLRYRNFLNLCYKYQNTIETNIELARYDKILPLHNGYNGLHTDIKAWDMKVRSIQ